MSFKNIKVIFPKTL